MFNILGPKILGRATTEIFNGLVNRVSGQGGIDFTSEGLLPVPGGYFQEN